MNTIFHLKQTKNQLKDLLIPNDTQATHIKGYSDNNWFIQNQILPNISPPIAYDQFIYTDKLTKKKIRMRQAKTSYSKGRQFRNTSNLQIKNVSTLQQKKSRQSRIEKRNSNSELEKQLTDLNQCFLMLKSTEMFKMNSLRQKIFASVDRSGKNTNRINKKNEDNKENFDGQIKSLLIKKKKIRQILEDSVKQANLKQFRSYYNDENHKINTKILAMNRHIPRNFNKSNIEKIISTLETVGKQDQNKYELFIKEDEYFNFPGEDKLKVELIQHMRKQIKKNGEYLIVPEKDKLLYEKLHNNIKNKIQCTKIEDCCEIISTEKNISEHNSEYPSKIKIEVDSDGQNSEEFNKSTKNFIFKEGISGKDIKFGQKQNCFRKHKQKKDNTCINFHSNSKKKQKQSKKQYSVISPFLRQFTFSPCQKSNQISKIKSKFEKNHKLKVKKYSLKQQRFLFLVENGLLFDVQKQILMNENYLFIKDKNQNNLLHICIKNHYTQMFMFIIDRLKKAAIKKQWINIEGEDLFKNKLIEKNKNNKNIFEFSKLYQAQQIFCYLLRIREQMNIRQYFI